jgi:hypothetical protein
VPADAATAPILVTGTGRSGTSLMRAMLDAHPRIHLAQEASFHTWMARWNRIPPRRRWERYTASFSFAWLRVDPADLGVGDDLSEADVAGLYARLLERVAGRYGKPRWGEKNPLLAPHLARLLADFPDARVIYMVRDPRACVASQVRMPWSSRSWWISAHLVRLQLERVWPHRDRVLFVKLEDLVAAPRETMARVLDFVGEDWDDAVLDHAAHVPADDGIPFPWLTPAEGRRSGGMRSWRELDPAVIREIEAINERTMTGFGYAPSTAGATAWARLRARLRDLPDGLAFLWRATALALRYARRPWPDAAEGQRLVCNLNPKGWEDNPGWTLPEPPRRDG